MLDEAQGEGAGERRREGREGGGEAAAAEAAEHSGDLLLCIGRGRRSERSGELGSICGGVSVG